VTYGITMLALMQKNQVGRERISTTLAWAVAMLIIGLLAALLGNSYQVTLLVNLVVTLIVTLSLNFVIGYSGQFSLAHAAFFGVGAYSSAVAAKMLGVPPILALPIALAVVASLSTVVGIPAARFHGYYLAVATLAFSILVEIIVRQSPDITGGAYGLQQIPYLDIFRSVEGRGYGVMAVFVLIAFIFGHNNLLQSRLGRAILAVRDNPAAAAAAGINVMHTRLFGFVISATAAALAGWLHTFYHRALNPMLFNAEWTFVWLFMVLVGGIGHWQGVILGTVLLAILPEFTGFATDQTILMVGALMIAAALFAPRGLGGLLDRIAAEMSRQ
jgi:branched-chain amino acid transport system permease protein